MTTQYHYHRLSQIFSSSRLSPIISDNRYDTFFCQVVIGAETLVSIVDAYTYTVRNLIRTDMCSTITQCTMYNAMDYTIAGNLSF